jgi:hypothetical protein
MLACVLLKEGHAEYRRVIAADIPASILIASDGVAAVRLDSHALIAGP